MAIDRSIARFLISCQKSGVSFRHTITLGRLNYFPGTKETRQLLAWGGLDHAKCATLLDYEASRFAEPLLHALGAEKVESLDASSYEGATYVHDMNLPVPDSLKQRFDVVLDAGTIEHVLNFPTVISNCMQMLKVGGHLILATPGNNFMGHGFYQFSPELWYRLLAPPQGFEVKRMVAVEYSSGLPWFEVTDPAVVKERVVMSNRHPLQLMVLARKVAEKPIFKTYPQQSDYVPRWDGLGDAASRRRSLEVRFRRKCLETFPRLARCLENLYTFSWLNKRQTLRNRTFFKPVDR